MFVGIENLVEKIEKIGFMKESEKGKKERRRERKEVKKKQ